MTELSGTTDTEIRTALHSRRFRSLKRQPDTLVIDELGLEHARSRVDIAVINGCVHGYEIKSAQDSLERLQGQLDVYRRALQKLTVVADNKHVRTVASCVPDWCGIIEVEQGPRGGIRFNVVAPARANPDVDPVVLAHLLWRQEVCDLLLQRGYAAKELRRPRKQLYEILSETLTINEISTAIREFMVRRSTWRDLPAHV